MSTKMRWLKFLKNLVLQSYKNKLFTRNHASKTPLLISYHEFYE